MKLASTNPRIVLQVAVAILVAAAFSIPPASAQQCEQQDSQSVQEKIVRQVVAAGPIEVFLDVFTKYYTQDAFFVDPSVSITGIEEIKTYLTDLFKMYLITKVEIRAVMNSGNNWTTTYYFEGDVLAGPAGPVGPKVGGYAATILEFNGENKIIYHRDIYDGGIIGKALVSDYDKQVNGLVGEAIGKLAAEASKKRSG